MLGRSRSTHECSVQPSAMGRSSCVSGITLVPSRVSGWPLLPPRALWYHSRGARAAPSRHMVPRHRGTEAQRNPR